MGDQTKQRYSKKSLLKRLPHGYFVCQNKYFREVENCVLKLSGKKHASVANID